jgi:hypothetical protein
MNVDNHEERQNDIQTQLEYFAISQSQNLRDASKASKMYSRVTRDSGTTVEGQKRMEKWNSFFSKSNESNYNNTEEVRNIIVIKNWMIENMDILLEEMIPAVAIGMFGKGRTGIRNEFKRIAKYWIEKSMGMSSSVPTYSNVSIQDLIESKLFQFKDHCIGCYPSIKKNRKKNSIVPSKYFDV